MQPKHVLSLYVCVSGLFVFQPRRPRSVDRFSVHSHVVHVLSRSGWLVGWSLAVCTLRSARSWSVGTSPFGPVCSTHCGCRLLRRTRWSGSVTNCTARSHGDCDRSEGGETAGARTGGDKRREESVQPASEATAGQQNARATRTSLAPTQVTTGQRRHE
jgi:hypothetical protein